MCPSIIHGPDQQVASNGLYGSDSRLANSCSSQQVEYDFSVRMLVSLHKADDLDGSFCFQLSGPRM